MHTPKEIFEIEIKSLLGEQAEADRVRQNLLSKYQTAQLTEQSQQLNHYFNGDQGEALLAQAAEHLPPEQLASLRSLLDQAKSLSVRTRQLNDKILLVLKAAIDDTTSQNGIARREFEAHVPHLSLEELDQLLLNAGFDYQAKWSREREAYQLEPGLTVSFDKNAGYGWLAEFEKIVHDPSEVPAAQEELRQLMSELEVEELPQDRLERMFAHYNQNWPKYYGTDLVFVVE
jgi:predicted adenylyl cyclase CyaB